MATGRLDSLRAAAAETLSADGHTAEGPILILILILPRPAVPMGTRRKDAVLVPILILVLILIPRLVCAEEGVLRRGRRVGEALDVQSISV